VAQRRDIRIENKGARQGHMEPSSRKCIGNQRGMNSWNYGWMNVIN